MPNPLVQIAEFPRVRVETAAAWAGDLTAWIRRPELELDRVQQEAAPSFSSATFSYGAGEVLRPGGAAFAVEPPLDLLDHWVRVSTLRYDPEHEGAEAAGADRGWRPSRVLFLGRFVADGADHAGGDTIDQQLTALGLEHELDVSPLEGAFVVAAEADTDPNTPGASGVRFARYARSPIVFNDPGDADGRPRGNRTAAPASLEVEAGRPDRLVHLFAAPGAADAADPLAGGWRWTALDALEHVLELHHHGRRPRLGSPVPRLVLAGQLDALEAVEVEPESLEGATAWEAINRLIDPRRGLGFAIRHGAQPAWLPADAEGDRRPLASPDAVVEAPEEETPDGPVPDPTADAWVAPVEGGAILYVYTLAVAGIDVGGAALPAAAQLVTVDKATPAVRRFNVRRDARRRYGRVVVQGGRLVSTFTVSAADGTLWPGWRPADENRYKRPPDLPADPDPEQADVVRSRDDQRHVYARFLIASGDAPLPYRDPDADPPVPEPAGGGAWDFLVGDGAGGTKRPALPQVDPDGTLVYPPTANANRPWAAAYRLLPGICLPAGESATRRATEVAEGEREVDAPPISYRPPLVLARDADGNYFRVEQNAGPTTPAHIVPSPDAFGFELRSPDPHEFGLNHFDVDTSVPSPPPETDPGSLPGETAAGDPLVDHATLVATVAVEADERLRVEALVEGGDPARALHVDVPEATVYWLAGNAVLDLAADGDATTLQRDGTDVAEGGRAVRDDAPRLRRLAAQAAAWYGVERQAIGYVADGWDDVERGGAGRIEPGAFIVGATVGGSVPAFAVNTPITSVSYDARAGTRTVATDFADVDFAAAGRRLFRRSR